VLLHIDLPALGQARKEIQREAVGGWVCASADRLLFSEAFDLAVFANSLHMLDSQAKVDPPAEAKHVLRPGGLLLVNSAFTTAPSRRRPGPSIGAGSAWPSPR
jgi:SAM-dependent methyltransferase